MSRVRSDQRGFTLIEVMLVCALFLVVTGATLTAFTSFATSHRRTEVQHDHAEEARVGLDRAARQLRNLANPTASLTTTISRAEDYDFIFQTSDPAKTWVRYCLETTGPAGADRARLWEAESTTAPTGAMSGSCPGNGWVKPPRVVTQSVSNRAGGVDRRIFHYECAPSWGVACPASAAEYPRITNVGIQLFVDSAVTDSIRELRVSTAVFLRNQNEPPVASATFNRISPGPRSGILNASGSTDPEGRTLRYYWFKGTAPTSASFPDCNSTPSTSLGEGITLRQKFSEAVDTPVSYWLVVRDAGCLTSTFPITIQVPA